MSMSWRMASMRWLEENHPEYVRTGSSFGAEKRLRVALAAMSYLQADFEAGLLTSDKDADHARARHAERWDEADHKLMVSFIKNGGYKARREALGLPELSVHKAKKDPIPAGEELAKLVAEGTVPPGPTPKKPTDEDDLADAVLLHTRAAGAGSW